jgi:glycine/serine hydroxymethyltransferase
MKELEMEQIGVWIADVLGHIGDTATEQRVRQQVAEMAARFPIYEARLKGSPNRAGFAHV